MYVLGTAGHVDHGKSSLVRALTGIDPDRLEEERRRAMTIDLGFAWLTLPDGRSVSIIDVPGHERFIKNMLAGVGGIDAALLVIAADEGVMPQTVEHIHILRLLGLERGLIVLTKADLVDEEWLLLVEEDVRQLLRGSALSEAPLISVSARTGLGIADLQERIGALIDAHPGRSALLGQPRLPIDRVFSVDGFGTVVTGTLLDGPLAVGDEVEVQPAGIRSRVRGLQSHGQKVERALPGSRVAINLAGVAVDELRRGDVLAPPGALRPTTLLDVRLTLVPDAPGPLEHNAPLDLFIGADETPCRVALLDVERLEPGSSCWAQLRLERPVAALRRDRLVLRRPSPSLTLGGGTVVDTQPHRHRRHRAEVLAALETLAAGSPADLLRQALADGRLHERSELLKAAGLTTPDGAAALDELLASGAALLLGQHVISAAGLRQLREQAATTLDAYHRQYPLRAGMQREELRNKLGLSQRPFGDVLTALATAGALTIDGPAVRLPAHTPAPSASQRRAAEQLLSAFRAAPLTPPGRTEWGTADQELLAWLFESGQLVRISPEVCFLPDVYEQLVAWVEQRLQRVEPLTLAEFRDGVGTSRKYAQAFLEHLDERRITRRVGDARVGGENAPSAARHPLSVTGEGKL